jgi:YHS domain-containing protein
MVVLKHPVLRWEMAVWPGADGAPRESAAGTAGAASAATRDPVCGMVVVTGAGAGTAEHLGQTYAFCSQRCRSSFAEQPDRYAASLRSPEPSGSGARGAWDGAVG